MVSDFMHQEGSTPRCVEVAAGLIFRKGLLLITQRHKRSHLGGLWEFPGGKREPDETFEECLVRELREELGVEVRVVRELEALTHAYPDKTVHLKFFVCRLASGEPAALDCAAVQWVGQGDLGNYAFPEADARLLERLRTDGELWGG